MSTTGGKLAPERIWVVYSSTPSLGAMLARSRTWAPSSRRTSSIRISLSSKAMFHCPNSASARGSCVTTPPVNVSAMERCLLSAHGPGLGLALQPRATLVAFTGP